MEALHAAWQRSFEKVIYSDLLMLGICLVVSLLSLATGIIAQNKSQPQAGVIMTIGAGLGICIVMITVVQVNAILRLQYIPDVREVPTKLVINASYWRNINIALITFPVLGCIVCVTNWIGVFMILWRVGAVYVVHAVSMVQLERAITANNDVPRL